MKIFNYDGPISRFEYWKRIILLIIVLLVGMYPMTLFAKTIFVIPFAPFFILICGLLYGFVFISLFKTLEQRVVTVGYSIKNVFLVTILIGLPLFLFILIFTKLIGPNIYLLSSFSFFIISIPVYFGVIKGREL